MNQTKRELATRVFYLNALNELGNELGVLLDVEAICNACLSVSMGTFGAMRGVVLVGDRETGELRVSVLRGIGVGETPVISVADLGDFTGQNVRPAVQVQGTLGELLHDIGIVTWMPIGVENRLIGGCGFGPKMSEEGFVEDDLSLLTTIAKSTTMALRNAIAHDDLQRANARLEKENQSLRVKLESSVEMASRSPQMQGVLALAERIADAPTTVLLVGESGTGKEVLARAIHQMSGRNGAFVPVHCAALSASLLESELFGHEKGAFTGAESQRQGRFELADGGTLFLDEVGEIPLAMQVKLLRVLQERQFERVGGHHALNVDVRVIAATNRDLVAAVKAGDFREDLYYRLNVVPITVLPLRERAEDIPQFVDRFLAHYCTQTGRQNKQMSAEAMAVLLAYAWPGNVRELQNMIERLVVVTAGEVIGVEDLPDEVRGVLNEKQPEIGTLTTLADKERFYLEEALAKCEWNQSVAARVLGISRAKLRARIKQYNIQGEWRVGAPIRKGTGM